MENLLDIEELYLFTQVVQSASFSQVCRTLRIPKPTLTRKIQNLEGRLNAQLLVRTTRSVTPTELGREIFQRALLILGAIEETQALISRTSKQPEGTLRLTAGVEFGLGVLGPLLSQFCVHYPKINVDIDLTGRFVDLVREGFDVGLRIGPLPDSTLSSRKLGSISYGLFASPNYLQQAKAIRTPEDLSKHPALTYSRAGQGEQWKLVSANESKSIRIKARVKSNNHWLLIGAAENGLGIAFMPSFLAEPALQEKRLTRVLPEWGSAEIPVHAVYPAQRYLSPKVRAFVDFVAEKVMLT